MTFDVCSAKYFLNNYECCSEGGAGDRRERTDSLIPEPLSNWLNCFCAGPGIGRIRYTHYKNYIRCREKKNAKSIQIVLKTTLFTVQIFFVLTVLFFGALEIIVFAISFLLVL